MNWTDFIIGFTLMNAMPHIILGVWKARMLSGFGFGNLQNILWGLFNLAISISLFGLNYGLSSIGSHAIYAGAVCMLLLFAILSPIWYRIFTK